MINVDKKEHDCIKAVRPLILLLVTEESRERIESIKPSSTTRVDVHLSAPLVVWLMNEHKPTEIEIGWWLGGRGSATSIAGDESKKVFIPNPSHTFPATGSQNMVCHMKNIYYK